VGTTIESVDDLAARLIFEVNRLHSTGTSGLAVESVTGGLSVRSTDLGLAINDPANETFSPRRAKPGSGTFDVVVRNSVTGSSQTARIRVDLDGITNAGLPGTADDTSVSSLAASISASGIGVTATTTADGRLRISVPAGYSVGFADDTSGVLASLEVNAYFTGADAGDIAVNPALVDQPSLLSPGRLSAGQPSDNATALAVAELRDRRLAALGDSTFAGAFDRAGQAIAVAAGSAKTNAQATSAVRESLDAQRAAIAGVSLDEEAINLVGYQQMYQASARFVSVVNDLAQTLLQLV
jgi:flagellar hook-associated protein 1 FlgK